MPVLRAYMAASTGVLPGRGAQKGDPFIGAALGGLRFLGKPLVKIAGKGIAKITRGRKLPTGLSAALKRSVKGVGGFGTAVGAGVAGTAIAGRLGMGGASRRYRRMNAGNAKALRRAFRRIDSFTKLAAKAGYVRRKPFGARKSKKVC